MNTHNDNSLLGFLQKKSLFANSPTVSRKRSRSRSKDSMNFDNYSNKPFLEEKHYEGQPITPKKQIHQNDRVQSYKNPQSDKMFKTFEPMPSFDGPFHTFNPQWQKPNTRNNHMQDNRVMQPTRSMQRDNDFMNSASNFQSARLQSAQCLQNLSLRINSQISSIHYKIDAFNVKMSKILQNEFRAVRETIMHVFDAAFRESERYIQEYMKKKEHQLAGQLIRMKEALEKESVKIRSMSEELRKPHWRRVAGQILSTELESRVEEMVKRSQGMEVGYWQLSDIAGYRIKNIENEIKEIVRLKT